jgi:CBS domain containing-hemolysin-like protein
VGEDEFIFSARLEIKYLNREYDLELPESDEYETLGGFINFFNENIPRQGDILSYGDYTFTILKTSSNRVETVRLKAEHS